MQKPMRTMARKEFKFFIVIGLKNIGVRTAQSVQ